MNFWFHYNKPASRAAKTSILSLHFNKKCHLIKEIQCFVPIQSKNKKRQPFCVMFGKAFEINIKRQKAIIT